MVQVFATKVYGYDPSKSPVLTFPTMGFLKAFKKKAEADALVCWVGTKGKETDEIYRGRILGIAECGSNVIDTESLLLKLNYGQPLASRNYRSGKFRYPYGITLKRAWEFPERPLAADVIGRLGWAAVRGCELLSEKVATRVLRLKKVKVPLPDVGLLLPGPPTSRKKGEVPVKPSRAPPPTDSGYEVTREKKTAFVYIFRFERTNIFKVGWAFDVELRVNDINQHIPSEVLDQQWGIFLWNRYADQWKAYHAEQFLLNGPLKRYRTTGERVQIREKELRRIWASALLSQDQ
jgi:hypothetical protein